MVATGLLPVPTFYVGDHALERVTKFRYLGRILSQDDHDLSACVRNIQRAKTKWAAVSKFARFYLVIVSTVLLYGSDTWVVTRRMEELLTSFHNRCLRHITKRYLGYAVDDWSCNGQRVRIHTSRMHTTFNGV
jgi:hypothetical protein